MLRSLALSAQLLAAEPDSSSYAQLNADFEAMKSRPGYDAYAQGFARSRAFPTTDELAACARLAAGQVSVIVVLDADGRVREAVADAESTAAGCYTAAFSGAKFEPPQFAPFVMAVQFRGPGR